MDLFRLVHKKNKNNFLIFSSGISLIEVMLSLAFGTLIIAGLVAAVIVAVRNSYFSRNQTLATKYAGEAMEWIRSERDKDWQTFFSYSRSEPGATYCLNDLSWSSGFCSSFSLDNRFKREATLKAHNSNKIEVEMIVSWQDWGGSHKIKLLSYFTRPSTWR